MRCFFSGEPLFEKKDISFPRIASKGPGIFARLTRRDFFQASFATKAINDSSCIFLRSQTMDLIELVLTLPLRRSTFQKSIQKSWEVTWNIFQIVLYLHCKLSSALPPFWILAEPSLFTHQKMCSSEFPRPSRDSQRALIVHEVCIARLERA